VLQEHSKKFLGMMAVCQDFDNVPGDVDADMEDFNGLQFSNQEKTDMVLIYGEAKKNSAQALILYVTRFPNRTPPNRHIFQSLCTHLVQHGSFINPKRTVPESALAEERRLEILAEINFDPTKSIRDIAATTRIPRSTVHRVLQANSFHPFKPFASQQLQESDHINRQNFATWYLNQPEETRNNILWTDESLFRNNGIVNTHNCFYWSVENPHWIKDQHLIKRFTINVWCGLLGGKIIGPHFFPGTLNSEMYVNFLRHTLPTLIKNANVSKEESRNIFFQQDGAPPHKANLVTACLNNRHGDKWIGLKGPVFWPPRSPDLTPLDFFLWGYLKQVVYATPVNDEAHLKAKIIQAAANIPEAMVRKATSIGVEIRCQKCLDQQGEIFENYL
jgi:hypothetical protein